MLIAFVVDGDPEHGRATCTLIIAPITLLHTTQQAQCLGVNRPLPLLIDELAGFCVDEAIGYSCVCEEGYVGRDCEDEIDPCSINPCKNDAFCCHRNKYVLPSVRSEVQLKGRVCSREMLTRDVVFSRPRSHRTRRPSQMLHANKWN